MKVNISLQIDLLLMVCGSPRSNGRIFEPCAVRFGVGCFRYGFCSVE